MITIVIDSYHIINPNTSNTCDWTRLITASKWKIK